MDGISNFWSKLLFGLPVLAGEAMAWAVDDLIIYVSSTG